MLWNEKCLLELTHHNMFESAEHRLRFRDLVTCYVQAPFFTKGLCKCMYLACWDETHFDIMLDMLNELTIAGARSLRLMEEQGYVMESTAADGDAEIMRLANSFLSGALYHTPDFSLLDPEKAHIIRRGLIAAAYIDDLPDPQDKRFSPKRI